LTDEERPLGQEPWPDAAAFLAAGEVSLVGRMPWSSNATFLVDVTGERDGEPATAQAVYKPHQGERPLWDFPDGLYQREVAAHVLSEALGWGLVPPTVVADGPLGIGSVQWFIDADFEQHYFTLYEQERFHHQLQAICAFDLVVNNTDRKGGHCLVDPRDHVWAIDNGLAFHVEYKLRTVIWEFGGTEVPDDLVDDLVAFLDRDLPAELDDLLDPFERDAIRTRARALVNEREFPVDHSGRRFPWPLV
jgi:uncharacterized repeat protein (TIGR03843 family)